MHDRPVGVYPIARLDSRRTAAGVFLVHGNSGFTYAVCRGIVSRVRLGVERQYRSEM